MAFDMTIIAPADDVDLTASATMRGLMSEAFQTVNFNGTPDEILAELKAGGGLRATSSLEGMEFKMDGKAEGEVFDVSFVADKTASSMNIDNGNASVSADINDIAFNAFVPAEIPLPCQVELKKLPMTLISRLPPHQRCSRCILVWNIWVWGFRTRSGRCLIPQVS